MSHYIDYLFEELSHYKNTLFKTVYIGGGTPSLLENSLLKRLLQKLIDYIDSPSEYTIEVNPESFTFDKFKLILDFGVNRISIGVQSFSDRVLKLMNRPTRLRDIKNCIDILNKENFRNYSLDLILGIQGYDEFLNDVKTALDINPAHLSLYMLGLSVNTELYHMKSRKEIELLDDETLAELYQIGSSRFIKNGYIHYEISNFAKPGFESTHNLNYWLYGDYVGIGLGAVSKMGKKRWRNCTTFKEYFDIINEGKLPICQYEYLSEKIRFKERLMLGLRTNVGFELKKIIDVLTSIESKRVDDFRILTEYLKKSGYMDIKKGKMYLTDKGYLSSNYIISEFFLLLDS